MALVQAHVLDAVDQDDRVAAELQAAWFELLGAE